jgi:hypothetical protein
VKSAEKSKAFPALCVINSCPVNHLHGAWRRLKNLILREATNWLWRDCEAARRGLIPLISAESKLPKGSEI